MAARTRASRSALPESGSASNADRSAQEPSDADDDQEVLPPRPSKARASQKWEMLKKKKRGQNTSTGDPPAATTRTKVERKKAKGRMEDQDRTDDADTYHAPQSIQLNTSDDGDDDIPEDPKPRKSSQESLKPHKQQSARKKASLKKATAAAAVTRNLSNAEKKSPGRSDGRARKSSSGNESLSEDSASDDEDEGEEGDDNGAIDLGAESLYWVDSDNSGEDDSLDIPPTRSVPASPHRTPPTSKRQRLDSDNDSGEQPALIRRPPPKKTKPDPQAPGKDNISRGPRRDEHELAQKARNVQGDPDAATYDSEGQRDSEDESRRVKAKAKEEAWAKERAKVKTKEEAKAMEHVKARARKEKKEKEKLKVVKWANKDKTDEDRGIAPAKKHRAEPQISSKDSADSDIDDHDTNIDLRCDKKGRPNLGEQPLHVQRVAHLAIFAVKQNILLKCAFPDSAKDLQDLSRNTLVRCAQDAGYQDMAKRFKDTNQDNYWRKFVLFPAQHTFLMHGSVKKITNGAVTGVYGLQPGNSEKVEWLQKNLTFIYPHDYKTLQVQSGGKLAFTLPIFESVLRAAFYDNLRSFGYKILPLFDCSLPEVPQEKELPASMLALVATAIYASLDDYRPAKYRAGKFEANIYTPVFQRCIAFLSKMKTKQPNKYHTLMHGLCQRLIGVIPGISNFDNDALSDFSADDD